MNEANVGTQMGVFNVSSAHERSPITKKMRCKGCVAFLPHCDICSHM